MKIISVLCLSVCALLYNSVCFPAEKTKTKMETATFSGLQFRSLGPAIASGRVSDIAVHPQKRHVYYVASSSGGVWKTENNGTTWTPTFDSEGSYSIGCVSIDPSNPHTVWVGSGENNNQRSVSYGDGVYRSLDGGASWTNMGLKDSEHIGMILVDPRNSDVVYVAAQGPLWRAGGDRGLYKTSNAGKTWEKILTISKDTGVNEILCDPRNPDVLFATSYQRRRRVWTLINGGPESALYKSTDAGATWRKIESGLPKVDMGRIGLAISPANPDYVYAIIEAANGKSGFFRSIDRGESWTKMSGHVSGSPQYYNEIVADPNVVDRVYSLETWFSVTEDGGKTFKKVNERYKHIDNHAMWIDPDNSDYFLVGCDGGVYETYDRANTWHFKANLPITQFYRVAVDNDYPIYNLYGGTQDNFTIGGPSRTNNTHGILNRDWFITLGGDGFETAIDPKDPNIIYSQWQNGGLTRYDKKSGEQLPIKPQVGPNEAPLRFNWDSPIIISPHANTRLYYAAQRLFRSDDRGNSWKPISGDLTRNLNRNKIKVMGKMQSVDAVAKNRSTSFYGNIVALSESPLQEGLLYVGTDDGLIQVSENSGANWRRMEQFPNTATRPYISDVLASQHNADVVYATFDAHKDGDFKPYIAKSNNRGKSWQSIAGNLPEKGTVYTIVEDHKKAGLLFVGTEFGVFFTVDDGANWTQLKSGIPTIAVRDLDIQKRENDLVIASFGRGFYILDDYSPLRQVSDEQLKKEARLFPIKRASMYMPATPLGLPEKSFQGNSYFAANNPAFGATFTYYLSEGFKTLKEKRQEKEKEIEKKVSKDGGGISYPTWDELRAEKREEKPEIILTVLDADGNIVRKISGPVKSGFHRVNWDLRYAPSDPVDLSPPTTDNPFMEPSQGPMAVPGKYTARLSKRIDGVETPLNQEEIFVAEPLSAATLATDDKAALLAFQQKTARLQRAALGASEAADEMQAKIKHIRRAVFDMPAQDVNWLAALKAIDVRLKDLLIKLEGDRVIRSHSEPTAMSIISRVQNIVGSQWASTAAPTQTNINAYQIAAKAFTPILAELKKLSESDLKNLEDELEAAGAPYTPGRFPVWQK